MAKNNSEAKIKFTAEVSDFNDAIKKSNNELAELRAELKLNSEQMKTNGKSIENLEEKHRILTKEQKAAAEKTEALSQKAQKAAQIFGENSEEASKLRIQLINAQAAEEKITQAINKCKQELEDQKAAEAEVVESTEELATENKKLADETDKVMVSTKRLSGVMDTSSGKFADARVEADKLEKKVDDAGDAAEDAEGGFTVLKGVVADLASEAIQLAIGKISEFIGYLKDLPEQTMELRQSFSTLETSFDNVGFSTKQAEQTWKDLYAVFGDDQTAVEAANHIARMSSNQKDLNSWVKISTGLYATYQDAINPAAIAESAKETAACGKITGQFADALNWSSDAAKLFSAYMSEDVTTAEDAFNVALANCSTEQERQALITETLTILYGDAAETYEKTAEGQIKAKEATADLKVAENDLAEAIEPVTTKFTELKTSLMEQFRPAIETVSGLMLDALEWAEEHPGAIEAIAIATGVLATAFGTLAITVGILTAAQWALNNAFLANPMTWVIAGIVAAVALLAVGLVKAYQECEWFRDIVNKIGEAFKWVGERAIEVKDWLVQAWDDIYKKCEPIIRTLKVTIESLFKNIGHWADYVGRNFKVFISDHFKPVADFLSGAFSTAISSVTDWFNNLKDIVGDFAQGALTWLNDKIKGIQDALWVFKDYVVELIRNLEPLAILIRDNLLESLKSLEEPINKIKEAFEKVWSAISEHLIPVLQDILVPLWENVLKPIFSVIAGAIGGTIVGAIGLAIGAFNGICEAIAGFAEALGGLAEIVGACFELIVGVFTLDGEKCLTAINDIWDGCVSVFGGLWSAVKDGLQGFVEGVVGFFTGLWDTLVGHSIVPDTIQGIVDCFGGLWSAVSGFVSDFVGNVTGFFSDLWSNVTGIASDIGSGVSGAFEGLKKGASNIWENMKKGASDVWGNITSAITGKASNINTEASKSFANMKSSVTTTATSIKDNTASAFNSAKEKATASFNSMKSSISSSANTAKTAAANAFNGMKTSISNGVSGALSTVSDKFGSIKTKISDSMNSAKNTVKDGISKIASTFSSAKLSLPDVKMPHFSVSGKFSLNPPSVPKIKVSWYADGGIFTKPTLFNTPYGLKGVGEAGAEAVLPIDRLEGYIENAIERTMQKADIQALAGAVSRLADRPIELAINGRKFAYATASDSDSMSGLRSTLKSRGLALD